MINYDDKKPLFELLILNPSVMSCRKYSHFFHSRDKDTKTSQSPERHREWGGGRLTFIELSSSYQAISSPF